MTVNGSVNLNDLVQRKENHQMSVKNAVISLTPEQGTILIQPRL